jgi:hypothetical protein
MLVWSLFPAGVTDVVRRGMLLGICEIFICMHVCMYIRMYILVAS